MVIGKFELRSTFLTLYQSVSIFQFYWKCSIITSHESLLLWMSWILHYSIHISVEQVLMSGKERRNHPPDWELSKCAHVSALLTFYCFRSTFKLILISELSTSSISRPQQSQMHLEPPLKLLLSEVVTSKREEMLMSKL